MKYILLVALWTDRGLESHAYEYAERPICEQVAAGLQEQAAALPDKRLLEIWCYPVKPFAEVAQ